MQRIFTGILMAALSSVALGQEFEVVSVKPSKSVEGGSHIHSDRGIYTGTNLSLRSLIASAYEIQERQVEGPDWLGSVRFDIAGKFPEALPKDREKYNAGLRAMMEKMLVDRFKVVVHRDRKTAAVYGLTIGKSGIKFKEVPDGGSHSQSKSTHYEATGITLATFADFLTRRVDRSVVDMTGLKGFYNLTLDWVPERRQSSDSKDGVPEIADSPSGPTLPVAVQEQLGLKLESRKAPIEILVVDHAERAPTEN